MTTDRLAALLHEDKYLGPAIHEDAYAAQHPTWPATECSACWSHAARLAAAGVTVAPTIDQLRAAASFHEDNGHSPIGCVVCEYRLALGVTVAPQPAISDLDLVTHGATSPGYEFASQPAHARLTDVVRDMLDGRQNDEQITVEVSLLWSLVYEAEEPKRRIAHLPPGIPTCPICLYRNPGAEPGDTRPIGEHDCKWEDEE